jgi:proteasome assembly chaperone (PAC2) family protein
MFNNGKLRLNCVGQSDLFATLNLFFSPQLRRRVAVVAACGNPAASLGGTRMKKIVYLLAVLAAASTAAVAKDLKQDKKAPAPAVSAMQMSDTEMDKVTAGAAGIIYTPGDAQMNGLPNSPFGGAYGGLVYPGHSSVCVNGCFF